MTPTAEAGSKPTTQPSLVHTIETTVHSNMPDSYQQALMPKYSAEFAAVYRAYETLSFSHFPPHHERLTDCRTYSWFVRHIDTGEVRVATRSCRLRWCPLCARARAAVIRNNTQEWLEKVKAPKFLTLTLKSSDAPLNFQIDALYGAFKKLRRIKSFKNKMRGGIWFFQITQNKQTFLWHPHIHVVMDSDYMPQAWLSHVWAEITHGSTIVDIRTVFSPERTADYVARYAAKPSNLTDLTPTSGEEIIRSLHGRRLAGTFGTGREIQLSRKKFEDKKKWSKLGSWNFIRKLIGIDTRASQIYSAWRQNKSLDFSITLEKAEREVFTLATRKNFALTANEIYKFLESINS